MSSVPPPNRPDPWAVVDHHARAAAARAGEGEVLNDGQRLALYAAAAPDLIGARPIEAKRLGHTIARTGGRDAEWWMVPLPGSEQELAWNAAGLFALRRPARRTAVAAGVAMLGLLLAFGAFGRLAGPRAIFPAVLIAAGLFVVVRRATSDWTLLDGHGDDPVAQRAISRFVATYERGVGDGGR